MIVSCIQRFKPLPSIGATHQMPHGSEEDHKDIGVCADSGVDLNSPSPIGSDAERRGTPLAGSTDHKSLKSDSKHAHNSQHSSQQCTSTTAKIDAKPPIIITARDTAGDGNFQSRVERTRGSSKSKVKHKPPVDCGPHERLNFEVPPEPPMDAPNTVMLKVRLPDGECIQRRFNYQSDLLRTVVHYAWLVMNSRVPEEDVTLSTNCVPKVVFSDLSLTLEQAGLVHNTLLHLDHKDQ